MKRSRAEQISSAVNQYLKRRQYMDVSGDKKSRPAVCSIAELALSRTAMNNFGNQGIVSFCSSVGDTVVWEQHFTRFKSFILNAIDPYHYELQPLLCPVFAHVYLEMLSGGFKMHAHKFYERHRSLFADVSSDDLQLLLAALQSLACRDDINSNKVTYEFRMHKYSVTLTEAVMDYLMKYLRDEDNVSILQIISQRLDITVRSCNLSSNDGVEETPNGNSSAEPASSLSPSRSSDVKSTPADVSLSSLQRVIQKVQEGPPPLPSICLYTLQNTYQGLCNISMSTDEEMLSAGFEDSRIAVWSLTPKPLPLDRDNLAPTASNILVDGDNPDDVRQRVLSGRLATAPSADCAILRAHSGPVYSTCYLHNSPLLLSSSADKTVRLWDVATRSNKVAYHGHNYPVFCVDSSPAASPLFASCSFDQTAKLWSTDRIYPLRTFIGHTRSVNCVRFHANGSYLATCASDSTVRMWSIHDAQPVRLMFGHRGMVMTIAFSPNGKYLASAGEDQRVKIWDLASGSLFADLRGHTDFVYSLAFSHDSSLLASGGVDGVIRLWEVNKSASEDPNSNQIDSVVSPSHLGAFPTNTASIHCLRFSTSNYLIAAGN